MAQQPTTKQTILITGATGLWVSASQRALPQHPLILLDQNRRKLEDR